MFPRLGARWFRLRPRSRGALESQVREELDAHLALAVDYLVARGRTRAAAEREARERFGDLDAALRRLYATANDREEMMNRRDIVEDLRQDLRLALRLFRRSPRFFAAAVVTLAIGIGANGAVFSILQSALLQPLPYRSPDDLVMLWERNQHQPVASGPKPAIERGLLTSAMVLGWRREASSDVGEVAAVLAKGSSESGFEVTLGDRALRLNGALVTPNFFQLLGVHAARGRVFQNSDETTGEPLVLLSDAFWRNELGADSSLVGRSMTLTAGWPRTTRSFVVAGILPRGYHYSYPDEVQIWGLTRWSDVERADQRGIAYNAVARLRPGVTLAQAQRRAVDLRSGLDFTWTTRENRSIIALEPIRDWIVGEIAPSLRLLGAVAALLLLTTCVTVSNGLLARVSERQQELSVRTALGAGRSRLVRQLLTEGALLSIAGAVAGTLVAVVLQPVLRALLPASVPRIGEISVNGWVIAFGAAMAAVTTILAGLAPAWGGTRFDPTVALTRGSHSSSATRSTVRWRQILIGAQAAIATGLLIFAALLLTSFWHLARVPLGFDGDKVLTVEMRLTDPKYHVTGALVRFQDELAARVRAIPGVVEAGLTSAVPFRGTDFMLNIGRFGDTKTHKANARFIDPGYFGVLRVHLLRGRQITDADGESERPVVVISESFARNAFGAEDPIGKQLGFDDKPTEVIGVVGDLRYVGFEKDPRPAVYFPAAKGSSRLISVVLRTAPRVAVSTVVPALRRAIREIDPALPAMNITTIDQILDASVANRRFYTVATASFASIALLLTIVGLVVVVGRVVTERRRELAIRAALGATMPHLARIATRDALVAAVVGVIAGLIGARMGSLLLTDFLFHVTPRSPATYSAVTALVIGVAALAAWGPVRRFDRVSLSGMLKAE